MRSIHTSVFHYVFITEKPRVKITLIKIFFPSYQTTLSGFKETQNLRNNNEAMCSASSLPLSLGRIDYKVILKSEQKEVFIYC